jgi:hypothetical protein
LRHLAFFLHLSMTADKGYIRCCYKYNKRLDAPLVSLDVNDPPLARYRLGSLFEPAPGGVCPLFPERGAQAQ